MSTAGRKNGVLEAPPKQKPGKTPIYNPVEVSQAIAELPVYKRRTLRGLSRELGIPKSSLHELKKNAEDWAEKCIILHSNAIKPLLHQLHLAVRMFYVLAKLMEDGDFDPM